MTDQDKLVYLAGVLNDCMKVIVSDKAEFAKLNICEEELSKLWDCTDEEREDFYSPNAVFERHKNNET